MMVRGYRGILLMVLAIVLISDSGVASTWCGENGVVRFLFVEGDTLVPVLNIPEPENGVTTVEMVAMLDEVTPVAKNGEAFLYIGGLEMTVTVDGGEAFFLKQEFPVDVLNAGDSSGKIVAGFKTSLKIRDGRAQLAKWTIMFQGTPSGVRFGLDPTQLPSCLGDEDCKASGTAAIYVGNPESNQVGMMFGAGYVPAWLNPEGEADLKPVVSRETWKEIGLYDAR